MTDTQELDTLLEAVTEALQRAHLIYRPDTGRLADPVGVLTHQPEGTFATGNPARAITNAAVIALVRAELDRRPNMPSVTDDWISCHVLPALRQRFAAWTEQPRAVMR